MTQGDKDAIHGQGIPSNGTGRPSSASEVQVPQTLTGTKKPSHGKDEHIQTAPPVIQESFEKQHTSMARRNSGKVARRARSEWLQLGLRLFGCWGPVLWLFEITKTQHRHVRGQQSRVLGSRTLAVCKLEVLRSSPLAVALVRQGGRGDSPKQRQARNKVNQLGRELQQGPLLGDPRYRTRTKGKAL